MKLRRNGYCASARNHQTFVYAIKLENQLRGGLRTPLNFLVNYPFSVEGRKRYACYLFAQLHTINNVCC
jgi:hypothetical protein